LTLGGIDYLASTETFPLSAVSPVAGDELFHLASVLSPNIAYYLPRNVDIDALSGLASRFDEGMREWVEIEEELVGDKVKAITAYFGGLVKE
jgi:trimethylguanosine synthase